MDLLRKRLAEVDSFLPLAKVTMENLTANERKAIVELANYLELPLGALLRRANAIRMAGGQPDFTNCLREAASHMIVR